MCLRAGPGHVVCVAGCVMMTQAMRRELVPIVSPLLNFARDRARRLSDAHAFPVLPDAMTIREAQFHLARKGLPPQAIKSLQVAHPLRPTPNILPTASKGLRVHSPLCAPLPILPVP